MQEEPDAIAVAAATHRVGDRDEMVVMDPDQIIFLDDLFELGGKMIIDLEISAEIPARELGKVDPVMQDWPQHAIGKAVVVFVKAFLRKIGNHIFDIVMSKRARLKRIAGCDLAAPAQPETAVIVKRWPQCDFETASAGGTVVRNRDAIRNDH